MYIFWGPNALRPKSVDAPKAKDLKEVSKQVTDKIIEFLGDDVEVKENKHGDKIFISKDKKRKVRFDIHNSHGEKPHMHIEKKSQSGKWKDAYPQHRIPVGEQ